MKKHIGLALIFIVIATRLAWAGSETTYKNFYKPSYRTTQRSQYDAFNDALDDADARLGINIMRHGAVGDGVEDDTAAINAAYAATSGMPVVWPEGTYKISSTITLPPNSMTISNNAKILGTYGGVLLSMGMQSTIDGNLEIDGNDVANSIGIQYGTGAVWRTYINYAYIHNCATAGIYLVSNGSSGVYYNSCGLMVIDNCGVGIKFETTSGIPKVNSNQFGLISIQSCTNGMIVNEANGNGANHLEIEACGSGASGWGIDLVKASGFFVNSGWLENNGGSPGTQNIRIANYPDVMDVNIKASIDNFPTSLSYTYSGSRSVEIHNGAYAYKLGLTRVESIEQGDDTSSADDLAAIRNSFSAGMKCYRFNAANPYFYFRAPTDGVGYYFQDNNGSRTLAALIGGDPSSGQTSMYLIYHDGTDVKFQRVTIGAIDSGGAGYRLLRVPN